MKPELPGTGHAKIDYRGAELRITIRSRKSRLNAAVGVVTWWIFVMLVSAFWIGGESLAPIRGHPFGFFAGVLVTWAVLTLTRSTLVNLAEALFGVARVSATERGIKISRSLGFWSVTKLYAAEHITRLRLVDLLEEAVRNRGKVFADQGRVMFDYGRKTVGFGMELDPADAAFVARKITERFPNYA
ncbi:MAG: hypothetical protein AAF409_01585 [Pseudomonadota bacterium]